MRKLILMEIFTALYKPKQIKKYEVIKTKKKKKGQIEKKKNAMDQTK